jgi:predicted lipoprotein with Yx(FWY)xxD motif
MIKAVAILGVFAFLSGTATAQTLDVPEGVLVHGTGAGIYFTTTAQQSLYWNERESAAGEVTCLEECLETWSPLQAIANAQSRGPWTIVKRADGALQWAYAGRPLYTYSKDTFPGARLGDGVSRGRWQILFEARQVPPGMKIESTLLGYVLTDHRGRTLYSRTPSAKTDEPQVPTDYWNAFEAPWLALDQGDWTIQAIAEGARQWSYNGQPLFTYDKDHDPQDVHGHRRDGVWSAVILEPAPGLPSWITIEPVDLGLAYANEDGLTLYAPVDIDAIKKAQTCPEDCMRQNWRPIIAKPGENSVGNWVIVENEDGQQQWSFKGQLLYTHTRDEKPGDMKGNGIAVGYRIGDGWRIIPVDSGLRRSRT